MTELKACPFCGGNARVTTWAPTAASVSCIMCGAHFNTYTEAEAIAAWNTRAERTCRIEKYRGEWICTACGVTVGSDDPMSELYIDGNAVELWNHCPNCGAHRTKIMITVSNTETQTDAPSTRACRYAATRESKSRT